MGLVVVKIYWVVCGMDSVGFGEEDLIEEEEEEEGENRTRKLKG